MPPAQSTTPETRRTNDGHAKQTRNPTSAPTTGQLTLSFFILDIIFGLAPPFSSAETTFGIFLGLGDSKIFTLNFVSVDNLQQFWGLE